MSWWTWLLISLMGYELVSLVVARIVYREMTFDNLGFSPTGHSTYVQGRHAGKAWGVAQSWGLWLTIGPPALFLYGIGAGIYFACRGIHHLVRWFIVSDTLDLKTIKPAKADIGVLTAEAEAKLVQVNKELDELQRPRPTYSYDPWLEKYYRR